MERDAVPSLQMASVMVVSDHLPLSIKGKAGALALLPLSLLKRLLARTLTYGVVRPANGRYTHGQWLMAWGELLSALSLSSPTFCMNLNLRGTKRLNASLLPYLLNLATLQLPAKACIDASLYSVAKLSGLQALALSGAPISAAGLRMLCSGRPSETLKALDVSGCCGIGDTAAVHIGELSALRWLNVSSTSLTENGVLSIVKALYRTPAPSFGTQGEEGEGRSAESEGRGLEYLSTRDIPMARGSLFLLSRSLRALARGMQGGRADEFRSAVDAMLVDGRGEFPDMAVVAGACMREAGWGQSVAPLFFCPAIIAGMKGHLLIYLAQYCGDERAWQVEIST